MTMTKIKPLVKPARVDPDAVRDTCPDCGGDIVSVATYTKRRGYLMVWECAQAGGENPACNYRRVL